MPLSLSFSARAQGRRKAGIVSVMSRGKQGNEAEAGRLGNAGNGPVEGRLAPTTQSGNRESVIQEYEAELAEARRWVRIIGSLNAISRFLAFCNLTWATVALLGAFLPSLSARDFAFVTSLVFVEAARLASVSFFLRLLMRPLAYGSQDPRLIVHTADSQYPLSRRARIFSNVAQLLFIVPSSVIPIIAQVFLRYGSATRNIQVSLRIFYALVELNSLVACAYLICSMQAFITLTVNPPEQSILRYFDMVLERAMNAGLVQADDFELFAFAFNMLGNEFRRNVQPEAVAKNHKRLIKYMYAHRLGVDFLEIYLDADDAYVRLAAVNMVGFWADKKWDVGVAELRLPEEILTKLADKVSTGQVGWAATTSFGVLASTPSGARLVASTRTSSNVGIPARLAYLVDDSSSRSLSLVRTLVEFYEQFCVHEQQPPNPFGSEHITLVQKLKKLATMAKVHRLRVQAAYLLLIMGEVPDVSMVRDIKPRTDKYWFKSEAHMLELLYTHLLDINTLPKCLSDDSFVREDSHVITVPSWAKPREAMSQQEVHSSSSCIGLVLVHP